MIRLLLDAHLSPEIARRLTAEGVDIESLDEWQAGGYRDLRDEEILAVAAAEQRVLVTYDQNTIPPLLGRWWEAGRQHAGVILIDEKTIQQNDIGGLVRALRALIRDEAETVWDNRIMYLARAPR